MHDEILEGCRHLVDWVSTLKDGPIVLCSTMQQQPSHGVSEMNALKNLLAPKP